MSRAKHLLLAGAVLPAIALGLPRPAGAAPAEAALVIAQAPPPDAGGERKRDENKRDEKHPPGQKPGAQQPGGGAPPPGAQRPGGQPPPAAQQHQGPAAAPPAAQQHQERQAPPPAAQRPGAPPPPAAQQERQAPPPAAQQHQERQAPPPAAQRPVPPAPATAQPAGGAPPPAAQQHRDQQHRETPPAAATQPPGAPPPPPAAQQRPGTPPAAAAQPPGAAPPPPTTAQPGGGAPPPPAAAQRPGTPPPVATQPPAAPPPPAAATQQPPGAPAAAQQRPGGAAPPAAVELREAPRDRQELLERRQRADEWRSRRIQDLRDQRQEVREGDRVVIREPDRTIIRENGRAFIRHSEVDRFGFGARDVQVQQRGRETVTIVERPGGIRIVTVVDDQGQLLRRYRRDPSGREIVIIDNPPPPPDRRAGYGPGFVIDLPAPVIRIPRERYIVEAERADRGVIFEALMAPPVDRIERRYSLDEIRYSPRLLERMPRVDIDTVNFESGSWEVTPDQAGRLEVIAQGINQAIGRNPQEVFLIEGHTDAVGSDVDNLSLSDRRAESVAVVLTNQFQVPPENLTSQGYGEQYLKVPTDGPEVRNRRVTVRRITPLLTGQNDQRTQ